MRKLRVSCITCPKSPRQPVGQPGFEPRLADSALCFYSLTLEEIKHPPDAQPGLTRGRRKPLRLLPGVQPKGSDSRSSYSAGSQRARARLEDPSQGLFLQQWVGLGQQGSRPGDHSACSEGVMREGRPPPQVRCSLWHPLVVASPSDGAVLVTALLRLGLDSTATGLGQQPQLGFC